MIGHSIKGWLLTVSSVERSEGSVRIISARGATKGEVTPTEPSAPREGSGSPAHATGNERAAPRSARNGSRQTKARATRMVDKALAKVGLSGP